MTKFEKSKLENGLNPNIFQSSDFKVETNNSQDLGVGLSEGSVRRIDLVKVGKKNRKISIAEKIFESQLPNVKGNIESVKRRIVHNFLMLKKIGLPTFTTLRTSSEYPNSIFTTDLTYKGQYDVVSIPDFMCGDDGRAGKFYGSEKKYAISNSENIQQQIVNLFEKCIKNNVYIVYPDVFFLQINKSSNEAKVVFGDLYEIEFLEAGQNSEYDVFKSYLDEMYDCFVIFVYALNEEVLQNPISRRLLALKKEELWKEFLSREF